MVERLAQFIEYLNISVRAFEGNISASNGLIRKAIANNTDIGSRWLSIIAEIYPQLSISWLLTGKGEMLTNSSEKVESSKEDRLLIIIESQQRTIEELSKKIK